MTYISKLPYRGLLIERPCTSCDTTDIHFEDRCSQGPCAVCGQGRGLHYGADPKDGHSWTGASYQPALIADAPLAFDALVDAARQMQMPAHFSSDLYRDYQALTNQGLWARSEPIRRFIWSVRDTGTDLLTPHTTPSTARLLLDRNTRHFDWNGFCLDEVSRETAVCLLAAYRAGEEVTS